MSPECRSINDRAANWLAVGAVVCAALAATIALAADYGFVHGKAIGASACAPVMAAPMPMPSRGGRRVLPPTLRGPIPASQILDQPVFGGVQ